ncbi:Sec-independent protein translocase protein TatB [Erythrobacter litoralis]|uniref:Sec-independent protein translocase protein TatB n=1 Tax=Erythrobacter litoralis (strain HTCC2594) TaxID=314225 RepID=TATB_ERYLH|nr:Sec-independent protein translocase protein TatB [Erythrobacter litoralis]Q2ND29.1 RecName: Full=Sec-independent protein translocase protein TatB [Erythrobacter litoralis HTCC2594]ABC62412.1 Sec-independent protein secretion pathway component [Erythrobacter litoralis HTCC2594]
MFDIGATELLVIAIVAILVIGPKDMPLALRTAGRWIGKIRQVSSHFRTGLDAMIREAEIEEMDKKWRERNAEIMAKHPADQMQPLDAPDPALSAAEARAAHTEAAKPARAAEETQADRASADEHPAASEPRLPLEGRD